MAIHSASAVTLLVRALHWFRAARVDGVHPWTELRLRCHGMKIETAADPDEEISAGFQLNGRTLNILTFFLQNVMKGGNEHPGLGTGNLDVAANALNSTANFKAHGWRAGAGYQMGPTASTARR